MGGGGKGGGSSGSGDSSQTLRYAPYLEAAHSSYLNNQGADIPLRSFTATFNESLDKSPYGDYVPVDVREGFFGVKSELTDEVYELKDFPSLWDMFGKFVAGLDVETLWGQIYEDVLRGPEIENAVSAHALVVQDQVDSTIIPKFIGGMRDINAVQSSAFVVGKALIQEGVVKEVNKFAAGVRLTALEAATKMWTKHLDWNQSVVTTYSELFKLFFLTKMDLQKDEFEYKTKDALWNLNLYDSARAMIGAMHGAAAAQGRNEPSQTQKALGGALTGAAGGSMIASAIGMSTPWGAAIGGAIGLASAFL